MAALALSLCAASQQFRGDAGADPSARPNVLILFADDFGYGDLASYGHPTQEYGHIDMMADQGMRFTQWYSSESICTPSRMGLMTGRMPTRMGMVHSVFSPAANSALPLEDPTLAEVLRARGYATGFGGKWHLGLDRDRQGDGLHLPFYRGFEQVGAMLPFSNHWACDESGRHSPVPGTDPKADAERNKVCFVYRNTTLAQQPIDHTTLTGSIVRDAVGFVKAHAGGPWLYYLAFPQCHVSMFTNTSFTNTSRNGIFGDNIREMDWAVGQVLEALRTTGQDKRTLTFFSSDHGPHVELCNEGGTAAHLRGGKGDSSWEGGLRVPGIAYWPGTIVPGVSAAVVSTMDIFATAVAAAGAPMPTGRIYDGRSLLPLLRGVNETSPHEALFHYCGDTLMAVRYKQWKLRFFTEQLPFDNYSTVHCTGGWAHGEFFQGGWTCHGGSVTTNSPPELMDVESDPAERYPLLTSAEWAAHSTFQSETLPADSALFSLPYYSEVDVAPRPQPKECGSNTATTPGAILNGYAGASINGSTEAQMLAACIARCCAEGDKCAAVTLQSMSLNSGDPIDQAMHPPEPGHPHATSAILRSPPPSGPYAPILREMDAIIARHLASMTRGTIPGGKGIPRPTQTLNYPGVV